MRVGVVSKWFNRGQPVVGRQTRSALDELGHETFVLARPKKKRGPRPGALDRDDVWDQPGVTEASAYDVPGSEYEAWVADNGIDVVFCDQNYQFAELASLRARGVKTIGRFVWEHFTADHLPGAREAYDVVFSLTRAEQERYREMGLETPFVQWGCHPELIAAGEASAREAARASGEAREAARASADPAAPGSGAEEAGGTVVFVFPGGFLGHRKPLGPVLEAFRAAKGDELRLLVKAQVERKAVRAAQDAADRDPRVVLELGDKPTHDHLRELASADVCLAPARWEGLGLPLFEAIAFGQPVITNDAPPMNEPIHHEVNGLLVASHASGTAKSGIPAVDPDVKELTAAIERLGDAGERERLAAGAREVRERERDWSQTVRGFGELLDRVA